MARLGWGTEISALKAPTRPASHCSTRNEKGRPKPPCRPPDRLLARSSGQVFGVAERLLQGLSILILHSRKDHPGVGRLGHLLSLRVDPILDMRAIAAQFFQKLNNLGDLVFAKDRQFERQSVAMRVEFVLMFLRDEHQHDDEQREQVSYPCSHGKAGESIACKPNLLATRFAEIHTVTTNPTSAIDPGLAKRAAIQFTQRCGVVARLRCSECNCATECIASPTWSGNSAI